MSSFCILPFKKLIIILFFFATDVLFHEYMSCESAEEKNKHMWKNVYLRNVKAAAEKMGVATIPSDSGMGKRRNNQKSEDKRE